MDRSRSTVAGFGFYGVCPCKDDPPPPWAPHFDRLHTQRGIFSAPKASPGAADLDDEARGGVPLDRGRSALKGRPSEGCGNAKKGKISRWAKVRPVPLRRALTPWADAETAHCGSTRPTFAAEVPSLGPMTGEAGTHGDRPDQLVTL